MSEESEKMKKLLAFKKRLDKRVNELESELEELKATLETVNSVLLEKGFKRPEITKAPTVIEAPQQAENEDIIPLKTNTDELLANLCVREDSLHVVPAEDKNFNINTPPFRQFLVERVLVKMQEKDDELVMTGELTKDDVFSYNIVQEGDIIREIEMRNFDADRLRELKSSIRWTLEKMYEKMKED